MTGVKDPGAKEGQGCKVVEGLSGWHTGRNRRNKERRSQGNRRNKERRSQSANMPGNATTVERVGVYRSRSP
jgi:hypothetical protein